MKQKPFAKSKKIDSDGDLVVTRWFYFLGCEVSEVSTYRRSEPFKGSHYRQWLTIDLNGQIVKFNTLSEVIYFLKNKERIHLESRRSAEFWKRVDRALRYG